MTEADRWARVGALFDAAMEKAPAEREAMLRSSEAPPDIQAEVLSLLAAHDHPGDFMAAPAAPPPALEAGAELGPYRVIRTLGRGGMGIVYLAEDTRLQRRVALKLLSPTLAGTERQRERLKLEARAAAALTHPNIATVYALEEFDGQMVIATEYVEGETLRHEMERGPVGLQQSLASAVEIARGVAAAHERGIVHRDLKPENILRARDGSLKILDFGLAKLEGAARELVSMTLTEAGLVAGTPPYMAPEQLLGRGTDFLTDQFAFGVLIYEMIAGRHPFGGQSLPSTIAHILAGEPEAPRLGDELPPALWEILNRCLQKDPNARFDSTGELANQLEALRETSYGVRLAGYRSPPRPFGTVGTPGTGTPGTLGTLGTSGTSALWWWQFHQLAAARVYWGMVWPAWHVHRGIGSGGLFFFFAILAAVVVSANLRIHLWFSSRVYPEHLAAQRADTGRWIRFADCAFVALLVAGGLMLGEGQAAWATLLISVGVGTAVAFLMIEPATAHAAFGN